TSESGRPAKPGSTDPQRRLGAQAHHLAARLLRSSFTQLLLRSLRCSAPTHDLAHLDTNSLAANRWVRAKAMALQDPGRDRGAASPESQGEMIKTSSGCVYCFRCLRNKDSSHP